MSTLARAMKAKFHSAEEALCRLDMAPAEFLEEDDDMKITCDENRYGRGGQWLGGYVFDTAAKSALQTARRRHAYDQEGEGVAGAEPDEEELLEHICQAFDRMGHARTASRLRRRFLGDRRRSYDQPPDFPGMRGCDLTKSPNLSDIYPW
jgi:hypothetical protein